MSNVFNVLLTHQRAEAVTAMLAWWEKSVPRESILIAFGGSRADFDAIPHAAKVFVDDPRLRTKDHQRERQSYTGVFRKAAEWMHGGNWTHVHFAEYDHLPLAAGLNERQLALLDAERADVLGFHLRRVDDTNCAHYLNHAADSGFFPFWQKITCRPNPRVILSMMPTGSFWTREAFEEVAGTPEPLPMYVEIFPPTLAHHLGFRLRDYGPQTRFVRHIGDRVSEIDAARDEGAWTIHPVKSHWGQNAIVMSRHGPFTAVAGRCWCDCW
jgi:hypothetical protein